MKQTFFPRSRIGIYKKLYLFVVLPEVNSSDYAQRLEKWNHQRRSIFLKGSLVYIILNGRHYGPNHLLGIYLLVCLLRMHVSRIFSYHLIPAHNRLKPGKKMPILGNLNFFAFKKGQREILFWCCESTRLFSDFKFLLIYFFLSHSA